MGDAKLSNTAAVSRVNTGPQLRTYGSGAVPGIVPITSRRVALGPAVPATIGAPVAVSLLRRWRVITLRGRVVGRRLVVLGGLGGIRLGVSAKRRRRHPGRLLPQHRAERTEQAGDRTLKRKFHIDRIPETGAVSP